MLLNTALAIDPSRPRVEELKRLVRAQRYVVDAAAVAAAMLARHELRLVAEQPLSDDARNRPAAG